MCGSVHDNPNFELDVALAVLSTGPVGIADKAGTTNVSLVRRTCRSDGTLLKPSKPLTAIDATFVPPAPGAGGGSGGGFVGFLPLTADGDCNEKRPCSPAAFQTHTEISAAPAYRSACPAFAGAGAATPPTWHFMLSIHLGAFRPSASDFYPALRGGSVALYRESRWSRCRNGTAATGSGCLEQASPEKLPDISSGAHRVDVASGSVAWRLFSFAPVLPLPSRCNNTAQFADRTSGWVLLGELDKITTVSPQRFTDVGVREDSPGGRSCVQWHMVGAADEKVVVSAVSPSGVYLEETLLGHACPAGGTGAPCEICL